MLNTITHSNINRRELLSAGALITSAGVASLGLPKSALADGDDAGHSSSVGQIYQLQAAFHRAKSAQDIDLMMSLWDPHGTLTVQGDPNSPYAGFDQLKAFWQQSGSFTQRRFSLVPSFKIQIEPRDGAPFLYFECHDVGNYDQPDRQIISDTFLAGTLRRAGMRFVFRDMTAGKAFPLSVDHYYFP